jgi:hypothetical protein
MEIQADGIWVLNPPGHGWIVLPGRNFFRRETDELDEVLTQYQYLEKVLISNTPLRFWSFEREIYHLCTFRHYSKATPQLQ